MAVSNEKKRISVSIDKKLLEVLQDYDKKNRRTVSAEIELFIEEHLLKDSEN